MTNDDGVVCDCRPHNVPDGTFDLFRAIRHWRHPVRPGGGCHAASHANTLPPSVTTRKLTVSEGR
jgi:hypothetical protein